MPAHFLGGKLFGLGAPELIVVLIILLVLYSGAKMAGPAVRADAQRSQPHNPALRRFIGYACLFVGLFVAFSAIFSLVFQRR